jgi:hypothetical protein
MFPLDCDLPIEVPAFCWLEVSEKSLDGLEGCYADLVQVLVPTIVQLVHVLLNQRVQGIFTFILQDDFFEFLLGRWGGNACEYLAFVFLFQLLFSLEFYNGLSRCICFLTLLCLGCFGWRFWFYFLLRNDNLLNC